MNEICGCDIKTGVTYEYLQENGTICHSGLFKNRHDFDDDKCAVLAASLLSGFRLSKGIIVWHDDNLYFVYYYRNNGLITLLEKDYDITFCHLACTSIPPKELINKYSTLTIYVASLPKEHLIAIGQVLMQLKSFKGIKIITKTENRDEYNGRLKENNQDISGFWGGRMAIDIGEGKKIINETYKTFDKDCFVDCILSIELMENDPVCLIENPFVNKFFNELSVAWRYISAYVPICVSNNDKFRNATGYDCDTVRIRTVNPKDDKILQSFMKFVNSIYGKVIAFSSDKKEVTKDMILYRYDKSYFME